MAIRFTGCPRGPVGSTGGPEQLAFREGERERWIRTRIARETESLSGAVRGDAASLYASRRSSPPCDVARLTRLLTEDPGTQAAFAGVIGVAPETVPETINSLTPVVLIRDTAVTNHIYDSSGAEPLQSVLQAGTPVLVDDRGEPRVQCACGNPLRPPDQRQDADTYGERWDSFDQRRVIRVDPAPRATPRLETVDLDTGETDEVSLGGTVELGGTLVRTDSAVMVIDEVGETTTVVDKPVREVFDDGAGGLVYTLSGDGSDGDEWLSEAPDDPADGAIWHLAAGATEAVSLTDQSDPGIWHRLMAVGRLGETTYVVYTPLHAGESNEVDGPGDTGDSYNSEVDGYESGSTPTGPLVAQDLVSGGTSVIADAGFSREQDISSASIGGDRLALMRYSGYEMVPGWVLYDASLEEIDNACGGIADPAEVGDGIEGQLACPRSGALNDDGELVTLRSSLQQNPEYLDSDTAVALDPVSFERSAEWELAYGVDPHVVIEIRQASAATIATTSNDHQTADSEGVGTLWDLETGEQVDFPSELEGEVRSVWVLEQPLSRPRTHPRAQDDDPSSDTEREPSEQSPGWEEIKDASIPEMCGHPPTTLVDGRDVTLSEFDGYFELLETLRDGSSGVVQGVPSEVGPLTAVVVSCNAGGVAWPNQIALFGEGGEFYGSTDMSAAAWETLGAYGPSREGVSGVQLVRGEIEVVTDVLMDGDPACCATGSAVLRIRPDNGDIAITSLEGG